MARLIPSLLPSVANPLLTHSVIFNVHLIKAHPLRCRRRPLKIHQRGVQWKQGVVICMLSYISLLYNTTPIHCTPFDEYPFKAPPLRCRRRPPPPPETIMIMIMIIIIILISFQQPTFQTNNTPIFVQLHM